MKAIIVSWKRSKTLTITSVVLYIIAAYFVYATFILTQIELKIAIGGLAIALSTIAYSDIRTMLDKQKFDQIIVKIDKMEDLLKEIQKEQKEQANSSSPIVTSLQALSQHYMDLLTKQKSEDE